MGMRTLKVLFAISALCAIAGCSDGRDDYPGIVDYAPLEIAVRVVDGDGRSLFVTSEIDEGVSGEYRMEFDGGIYTAGMAVCRIGGFGGWH